MVSNVWERRRQTGRIGERGGQVRSSCRVRMTVTFLFTVSVRSPEYMYLGVGMAYGIP